MQRQKNHTLRIGDKTIGGDAPCFVIAEAGVNHVIGKNDRKKIGATSSLDVAYHMVDAAKAAGVDAIKFQSFTADTLQFRGTKKPAYQTTETSYYDLIKGLETKREDQKKIADYCRKRDVLFFSTPYDPESADFLKKVIGVPLFKLASIELHNDLFIRHIAKTGIPFILSTGLSTIGDVREIVSIARKERFVSRMILLQCTSNYPTKPEDIHLNVLKTYMREFPDIIVGLSDHSPSDIASLGAVAIGAKVLEKHFTLDKSFEGPDHSSSLNPNELTRWVTNIRDMEASLGSFIKQITPAEKQNESMRKYLVLTPQKKGTKLHQSMFRCMRTGTGVLPVDKNLKRINGKTLKVNVPSLAPFYWDLI